MKNKKTNELTYFEQQLTKEEMKLYGYGYNKGKSEVLLLTLVFKMTIVLILLFLIIALSYAAVPSGYVHYYEGSNLLDSAGTAHLTDTYSNVLIHNDETCYSGGCFDFHANSASLTYPITYDWQDASLAFWAKTTKATHNENQFFMTLRTDGNYYFTHKIVAGQNKVNMKHRFIDIIADLYNTNNVKTNIWQHHVLTWDSNRECKIYIDGSLVLTKQNCKNWYDMPKPMHLNLGNYGNIGARRSLKGYLDEVYIYDRALDQEEVTLLYTGVNDNPTPPPVNNTCSFNFALYGGHSIDINGVTYYILNESQINLGVNNE